MDTSTEVDMATDIQTPNPVKNNKAGIDLTLDYHAHSLPGCDHGSNSLRTSLAQIAMAKAAGIRTICATPHFYPDRESVGAFLARRQETYELLLPELDHDDPAVQLGAEVLICESMERLKDLALLCRQGTNELLLEMPFYRWPDTIWDTMYQLHEMNEISLVIAHADRYPPEDIEQIIQEGIKLQLNAECLTKPLRRKRYLRWIEAGCVQYLGSDIHQLGPGYRDWEKCTKLIQKGLGQEKNKRP